MMLDVTAGNRMLWPNKNPPNTVFMDKEVGLRVAPDIFGAWNSLPFRDDSFDCIMFDPPHLMYMGPNSMHRDPGGQSWWGLGWKNRMDLVRTLVTAQREFSRVGKRLLFKWGESRDGGSVNRLLSLFTEWREIHRYTRPSQGRSRNDTHWVTFIRRLETRTNKK